MSGPAHFGPEEKADFSEWTDLVTLEGGEGLGGRVSDRHKKGRLRPDQGGLHQRRLDRHAAPRHGDRLQRLSAPLPAAGRARRCPGLFRRQNVAEHHPGPGAGRPRPRTERGRHRRRGSVGVLPEEMIREIESWKGVPQSVRGGRGTGRRRHGRRTDAGGRERHAPQGLRPGVRRDDPELEKSGPYPRDRPGTPCPCHPHRRKPGFLRHGHPLTEKKTRSPQVNLACGLLRCLLVYITY